MLAFERKIANSDAFLSQACLSREVTLPDLQDGLQLIRPMNFLETTIAPKARGPIIKRILIRCPSTAKLTPSGQTIREDLWAKAKVKSNKLNCPHCGQSHTWSKKDVVLAR